MHATNYPSAPLIPAFTPSQPYKPLRNKIDAPSYYSQQQQLAPALSAAHDTMNSRANSNVISRPTGTTTTVEEHRKTVSSSPDVAPGTTTGTPSSLPLALLTNHQQNAAALVSANIFSNVQSIDHSVISQRIEPKIGKHNTQIIRTVIETLEMVETGKGVLRWFFSFHYWPMMLVWAEGVVGPVDELYYTSVKSINLHYDYSPIQRVYYKPGDPGEPNVFVTEIIAAQNQYTILGEANIVEHVSTIAPQTQLQLAAGNIPMEISQPPPQQFSGIGEDMRPNTTHHNKHKEKRMEKKSGGGGGGVPKKHHGRKSKRLEAKSTRPSHPSSSSEPSVTTNGSGGGGFFSKLFG